MRIRYQAAFVCQAVAYCALVSVQREVSEAAGQSFPREAKKIVILSGFDMTPLEVLE